MTDDLTLEQQRDLAMWMFPRAWARAEAEKGERRRRKLRALRQKAAPCIQVAWLRHQGHSCADCRYISYKAAPGVRTPICDLNTDFFGYALTSPDRICHDWKARS